MLDNIDTGEEAEIDKSYTQEDSMQDTILNE